MHDSRWGRRECVQASSHVEKLWIFLNCRLGQNGSVHCPYSPICSARWKAMSRRKHLWRVFKSHSIIILNESPSWFIHLMCLGILKCFFFIQNKQFPLSLVCKFSLTLSNSAVSIQTDELSVFVEAQKPTQRQIWTKWMGKKILLNDLNDSSDRCSSFGLTSFCWIHKLGSSP